MQRFPMKEDSLKKTLALLGLLFPAMTLQAAQLYLTADLKWTPEAPDNYIAEYEGDARNGMPNGQGVGYYYGSLELCEAEEADEEEETDPEFLAGLCLEPSREMALYEGEWRDGKPFDGIIAQGEGEAVIEQGILHVEKSRIGDDDDDDDDDDKEHHDEKDKD